MRMLPVMAPALLDPEDEQPASPTATTTAVTAAIDGQVRERIVITGSSEAHRADPGNEPLRPASGPDPSGAALPGAEPA
jgi:hypothetical protein